jgi:hypothetical protein
MCLRAACASAEPPSGKIIAATSSAFAKVLGSILIIGVDDKGEVVGLSVSEANQATSELHGVVSSLMCATGEPNSIVMLRSSKRRSARLYKQHMQESRVRSSFISQLLLRAAVTPQL